jgi:competence ComEA-like helix-hairpin-helix protein
VLIAFVLILSVVLLLRLFFNRAYVADPQPIRGERFDELVDRLDPNAATWQELAVIPQLGETRAKAIVAYRDEFSYRKTSGPAFARADDLLKVKGIGVALLQTIRPHLTFPASQPTTRGI